jgi:ATP-dependent Clp protease ATP-binding subunit ClpC
LDYFWVARHPLTKARYLLLSNACQAIQIGDKRPGLAAEYLHEHGVRLAPVREELKRAPHKYSESEKFVREAALPEDVVEQQDRVSAIFQSVREAAAQHDFAKARQYSDEERIQRDKLRSLYRRYGLIDWLYE